MSQSQQHQQQHQQQATQPARPRPQRNPPPALFLHPSPAASHVSLAPTAVSSTGVSSSSQGPGQGQLHARNSSALLAPDPLAAALSKPMDRGAAAATLGGGGGPPTITTTASRTATTTTTATTGLSAGTAPAPRRGTLPPLQTEVPALYARRESTRATDRTDALWAEMQATLEEVELSASGGTRVFGPDHDRKLAELRAAQIELAQAWARSEADEAIETASSVAAAPAGGGGGGGELRMDGTGAMADGGGAASIRPGSAGAGAERLGRKLDEETESDIRRARERRKANDRYFQRVNQGVLDVVAKLEGVATAMRAVEQESKDVWGDDSVPSSARPSDPVQ